MAMTPTEQETADMQTEFWLTWTILTLLTAIPLLGVIFGFIFLTFDN